MTSAPSGRASRNRPAPANAVDVEVSMRFGDIDSYGHLNNVATFALLEEARIKVFWAPPGTSPEEGAIAIVSGEPGGTTAMLVASQRLEYLKPISYRLDPLRVQLWIGKLGGATLLVNYYVRDSRAPGTLYARAETLLVCADPATMSPRRLTKAERQSWSPLVGERLAFIDR